MKVNIIDAAYSWAGLRTRLDLIKERVGASLASLDTTKPLTLQSQFCCPRLNGLNCKVKHCLQMQLVKIDCSPRWLQGIGQVSLSRENSYAQQNHCQSGDCGLGKFYLRLFGVEFRAELEEKKLLADLKKVEN